ncbi:MAG TPA: DUF6069 family protein [Actinoplanes sp.]|jgi:hypothetical protein
MTSIHTIRPDNRRTWTRARNSRGRFAIVLAAMAAASAGWAIAKPLLGIDLTVATGAGTTTVEALTATLVSLGAGFAAWALLAVLERLTSRARTVWTVIAVVVFLVSLTGPLGAVTTAGMVALMTLHTVVAVILIVGLRHFTSAPEGGRS